VWLGLGYGVAEHGTTHRFGALIGVGVVTGGPIVFNGLRRRFRPRRIALSGSIVSRSSISGDLTVMRGSGTATATATAGSSGTVVGARGSAGVTASAGGGRQVIQARGSATVRTVAGAVVTMTSPERVVAII
jgi:hypothetical protein